MLMIAIDAEIDFALYSIALLAQRENANWDEI